MEMIIVSLIGEDRDDGTYHVYSPNVPGFHVVQNDASAAYEQAIPILEQTLARRAKAGNCRVEVYVPVEVDSFVPDEIQKKVGDLRYAKRAARPTHLVAAVM